jgi:alpha-mannosidase
VIRHREYARRRLLRVAERLHARVYRETRAADELRVSPAVDRIGWEGAQRLEYRPADVGERFGPRWATYWFRVRMTVPEEWRGRRVDLLWVSGSEAALWQDGRIVQGLNTGGGGERPDAVLAERAEPGPLGFQIELACNGMFGEWSRSGDPAVLDRCELACFDPDAWRLYFDFEALRALEGEDGLDPSWAGELLSELDRFCTVWEHDPAAAAPILAQLYTRRNAACTHELAAIGHAHIDTAWLWPLEESYRKVARTFATQTRYLADYPEYRFAASQAQHYAWVKERNPDLWARVRDNVEAGRFVPVGGTWIEPDCNLPSGESLVRQFLHGQRFFEREFGRRCGEFWSPDAFGYAGQLPQIMREAGITRFLTQKLSWNRFTAPEHHTFTWQGDDGSEVLTHFPPAATYSSDASVADLRRSAAAFKDHESSSTSLLVFGYGDGGGGPTKPMLETLRRARDLQGVPRTTIRTSEAFFDALESEPGPRPTVLGELYLEYHRGTYTSQARLKALNRRCELALHDAEFLAVARGGRYPRAELECLWRRLLLNQFHDILPGSSIGAVAEEAERDLAAVEAAARALCEPAGEEPVNTIGVARREVVEHDGALFPVAVPSYGAGARVEADDAVRVEGLVLENRHLRAELAAGGMLVSLVHKPSGREALASAGNRLERYDDRPVDWDAWDIDPFHLDTRRDCSPAESWSVLRSEPLRGEIAFERAVGESSRMTQTVRLDAMSRCLEFRTVVDWHERHTLLKVCFPVAARSPNATYEMPFGYAERPTHFSTARDAARYEVPGHRWADLSEHGFGVAVLTDSKYGYSCYGGELRVSLLRAPRDPDPEADQGRHEFAYAVLPHAGGWREAGVVAEALRFNAPVRWTSGVARGSLASVDSPNVVLDTIKRAEDSDDVVLRLYETHGGRGSARVRLALPVAWARRANVLEDDGDELALDAGAIVLPYRPHEILTIKAGL